MILVFITIAGVAVLVSAGISAVIGDRFHPVHRVRLTLGALLTGLFVAEAGLILWATPVLLDIVGLVDLAEVCRRILGGPTLGGTAGGVIAGLGAVWLGGAMFTGWWGVLWTQRRLRIESAIAPTDRREGFDLYVLASPRRMAYTVGGRRPQVVLTSAVVDELPFDLVEVITAHERVHARNRHHRLLALAAGVESAAGWLYPVGRAVDSVRLSLERWADEDASLIAPQGRDDVRKALLSACLSGASGATGFGDPEMVSARISALESAEPSPFSSRLASAYVAFGCAMVTSLAVVSWATHVSILVLSHPGQCLV
ncbi:MAG: M56 family metallopeptidase [Acidimicrobiia bacterium]